MILRKMAIGLSCLGMVSLAVTAKSEEKPLWELGLFGGGGRLPDYPAADQSHIQGLALPYGVYRGPVLRLGDGGAARGIVFDDGTIEFDLGLDAAFPVDADDNDARRGMDDLDFLLEIGPRITYSHFPDDEINELDLSLTARVVASTDFANWHYQGINLNPALTYRRNRLLDHDLRGIVSLSPLFGLAGLNRYFYRVAEGEALPGRPAFDADNGYIGTELSLGFSWGLFGRIRLFGGVQLGFWDGAANSQSPLHRDTTTLGVGGGIRWSIFQSETMVER